MQPLAICDWVCKIFLIIFVSILLSSCNWYTLRVANTKFFCLILYPFSCNLTVVRVAIDIHSEFQILSNFAWYYTTPSLQPEMYTSSCKYWVLLPDIVLPLLFQLDSGSSCNRRTLRVANIECFRLILYYPFCCNQTVVQVAIDIHFELQVLCSSAWY
jgi:hypothetical protein